MDKPQKRRGGDPIQTRAGDDPGTPRASVEGTISHPVRAHSSDGRYRPGESVNAPVDGGGHGIAPGVTSSLGRWPIKKSGSGPAHS